MKNKACITVIKCNFNNGLWYHHPIDSIDVRAVINAVEQGHCINPWAYTIYQLLMAGF